MPKKSQDWYTAEEAAAKIKRSLASVYDACHEHDLGKRRLLLTEAEVEFLTTVIRNGAGRPKGSTKKVQAEQ